jgi:uncharacterized 2Fe-2S/4Fe-4S cluster protein (DUF4445 family)
VLAAAIDLGTTNLAVSLLELPDGQVLGRAGAPNPQAPLGADVLTRLHKAQDPVVRERLQWLVLSALSALLGRICAEQGRSTREIEHLALAGNTVMIDLLCGRLSTELLWPVGSEAPTGPSAVLDSGDQAPLARPNWADLWQLAPWCRVEVLPALGGFIGSDLLAGLLVADLEGPEPALLVDFGTNTELALWTGNRLLTCAAAGGPAFEGIGVGCGRPAGPGAIYRVEPDQGSDETLPVRGFAFDGEPATGLCGSALVDLLALLLDRRLVSSGGRLLAPMPLRFESPPWRGEITNRDIDSLQRAKAAVASGLLLLCREAALAPRRISRVLVAGAFGGYLSPVSAARIGLLPELPAAAVTPVGNTSLAGCERHLTGPGAAEQFAGLRERAEVMALSGRAEFEELFFENLFLRPLTDSAADLRSG